MKHYSTDFAKSVVILVIKKISFLFFVILLFSTSVFGNIYEEVFLEKNVDIKDSKYFVYETDIEINKDRKETIESYIYVVMSEEFVWIENLLSSQAGIYNIKYEDIKNIEQNRDNQSYISFYMKNGEIIEINSLKQNENQNNIIYTKNIDGERNITIKEDYSYLFDVDGNYNKNASDKVKAEKMSKEQSVLSNTKSSFDRYKQKKETINDMIGIEQQEKIYTDNIFFRVEFLIFIFLVVFVSMFILLFMNTKNRGREWE